MKKIFALLGLFAAGPAMAGVDIVAGTNTADCDSDVLKTTSGSANLEANWDPNTINLNWYADDTLLSVQTGAQTCKYDGAITLPTTQPTKPGYTFDHWTVRSCFAGVDLSINGGTEYSYGINGKCEINGAGWDTSTCSNSGFVGMSAGQWATEFSYGVVRGIASCNGTKPSEYDELWAAKENGTITEEQMNERLWGPNGAGFMPNETFNSNSTGQYCWCQFESYTPNGGNICSVTSPLWVFDYDRGSVSGCGWDCARHCALKARGTSAFRAALYGVVQ